MSFLNEFLHKVVYEVQKVLGMTVFPMVESHRILRGGKGSFLKTEKIDPKTVTELDVTVQKVQRKVKDPQVIADFLAQADTAKEIVLSQVKTEGSITVHFKEGLPSFYLVKKNLIRPEVSASDIALTWVLRDPDVFRLFDSAE